MEQINQQQKHRRWKYFTGELRAAWALAEKRWRIDFRYPMSLLYFSVAPILWLLPQLIYGSAIIGGRFQAVLPGGSRLSSGHGGGHVGDTGPLDQVLAVAETVGGVRCLASRGRRDPDG